MATAITYAGETLIAQKQAAGAPLIIEKFILALVPELDPNAPVNRADTRPDNVVHEYTIPAEFKSFLNPNQVVYSMLLGSNLGNFTFNWIGLAAEDGTIVTVTYLPEMEKLKTANNVQGNNLTRNVLLEFSGAQDATGITIPAKTWQIDFTARLDSIDDRMRKTCRDIYGRQCFIKDAALIKNESDSFTLQAGFGYIEGIRVDFSTMPVALGSLPKKLWLDVALQQQGADKVPAVQVLSAAPAEDKADYTDSANDPHYLVAIADINAAGVVTDLRRVEQVETDLVKYLLENGGKKEVTVHLNDANPHGLPLEGGEEGQVLIKQADGGIAWGTVAGVPVGELCFSTNGEALPGTVPANVKQKVRCTLFPQLFEWMKGGTYLTDEAAWDAEAAAQDGTCGKYCWDGGEYFILPCFTKYFAAAHGDKAVGDWAGDAIRNITGRWEQAASGQSTEGTSAGAIRALGLQRGQEAEGSSGPFNGFDFDASREVPTAEENRPKTAYVLPCIKAFDIAINAAQIDMQALAQQVAAINGNKVDRSEWVELVPGKSYKRPDGIIEQIGSISYLSTGDAILPEHLFPVAFTSIPHVSLSLEIDHTINYNASVYKKNITKNGFTPLIDRGATESVNLVIHWKATGK
ncbi:phage tail protein (plasmid) [Halodesulfovibrio aestuarii]|uniref:H-type lectin domain-containing protein n=1 Tax=Halodesulfovibrio aestuarii TaxID=126333 RepID=A0A8G2CC61_9BACT|nr:phage tail protein [Halodesulfovibrio aestuarii]SHJ72358.1 H-type lectin domain-containing protein [Halodesulfovibrio aestuarii]